MKCWILLAIIFNLKLLWKTINDITKFKNKQQELIK